jgi:pimeloyl-ACP methyl ester carboxylesterase
MLPLKTLQLPQGPVQYLERGRGQPIVFVHGLLVDNKLWQPIVAELSQGLRCIAPNWPLGAHAVPMAPTADLSVMGMTRLIADLMTALDLRDVILVGNDTGGALAQMVCAHFPERIASVVLTTCDAYDVFPPPAFAFLRWLGHSRSLAWLTAQLMHHVPPLRRLPFSFGGLTDGQLDDSRTATRRMRAMPCATSTSPYCCCGQHDRGTSQGAWWSECNGSGPTRRCFGLTVLVSS